MINRFYRPNLVENAEFEGSLEFPIIEKTIFKKPDYLVPFDKRNKIVKSKKKDVALHFYIPDSKFKRVIERPEDYIEEFKEFGAVISLDTTIYIDAPLINQINVMYENRAIGVFWQKHGVNVIPNVRWGDERSFPHCFLGLKPHSIYAISTHGCIRDKDKKKLFREGLDKMLEVLHPLLLLVHGPMPKEIFGKYDRYNIFVSYDSWIKLAHQQKDIILSLTNNEEQLQFNFSYQYVS